SRRDGRTARCLLLAGDPAPPQPPKGPTAGRRPSQRYSKGPSSGGWPTFATVGDQFWLPGAHRRPPLRSEGPERGAMIHMMLAMPAIGVSQRPLQGGAKATRTAHLTPDLHLPR